MHVKFVAPPASYLPMVPLVPHRQLLLLLVAQSMCCHQAYWGLTKHHRGTGHEPLWRGWSHGPTPSATLQQAGTTQHTLQPLMRLPI